MDTIAVIDDDRAMRFALKRALGREFDVREAENGEQGLVIVRRDQPRVVLLDLHMPGMGGMEVLARIREERDPPPVIVLTAHGSERIAVEAMKKGAFDYLPKPYDVDELRLACRRALEVGELRRENTRLKGALSASAGRGDLIGRSPAMGAIADLVARIGPLDATVLVWGESGTGKELVARALHAASPRAKGPFIAINCAALPEALVESELFGHERGAFTGALATRQGRFESAKGGTLFLDEIGEAPAALQAKLLRVLETRRFERVGAAESIEADVRLVAATNRDLKDRVKAGQFREDLYYRLKVIDLHLPPLRARGADEVALLARHFVEVAALRHGLAEKALSEAALGALVRYSFPGNVRELCHLLEKAVILARTPEIRLADLPPEVVAEAGDLAGLADDRPARAVGTPGAGPERASTPGSLGTPSTPSPAARDGAAAGAADDDDGDRDDDGDGSALDEHQDDASTTASALPGLAADADAAASELDALLDGPEQGFAEAKRRALERFEETLLRRALARHRGNVSRTARALGLHRQSLQAKLRELGIDAAGFRA